METARAEIKKALPRFNKTGRMWVWGPNARAFLRDGCDAKVGAEPFAVGTWAAPELVYA